MRFNTCLCIHTSGSVRVHVHVRSQHKTGCALGAQGMLVISKQHSLHGGARSTPAHKPGLSKELLPWKQVMLLSVCASHLPAWGLRGACVGPVWGLRGSCVGPVWVLCGSPVWVLCGACVWACVGPVWGPCGSPVWGLCGAYLHERPEGEHGGGGGKGGQLPAQAATNTPPALLGHPTPCPTRKPTCWNSTRFMTALDSLYSRSLSSRAFFSTS